MPFVHFLLGKLHITEAVSGKSICEYLGSMRKVHTLDKMGTIEFEREIAVWSELLLFACDQRIGSVEHDTRGTVSVSREALPADPVPLALGMSGDHLGLAMTKAPGVSPSPQGVTILWPTRPSPHFDDAAAFRFDSRAIGSRDPMTMSANPTIANLSRHRLDQARFVSPRPFNLPQLFVSPLTA